MPLHVEHEVSSIDTLNHKEQPGEGEGEGEGRGGEERGGEGEGEGEREGEGVRRWEGRRWEEMGGCEGRV